MASASRRLREAELALINAPFAEDGWAHALDRVTWACGGTAANLVGIGGPLHLSLNLFTGRHADRAQLYFTDPALWGACNWRVGASQAPLAVSHDEHYRRYRDAHPPGLTADYDDAVADLDMPHGCQSVLMADPTQFIGLALMRGRDEGACDAESVATFARLAEHAQRSVRAHLAIGGEHAKLVLGNFGDSQSAVMLLDRFGSFCAVSAAAIDLLDRAQILKRSHGRPAAVSRADDVRLQGVIAEMLRLDSDPVVPSAYREILLGPLTRRLRLCLLRLPGRHSSMGFEPQLALVVHRGGDSTSAG